MLKHLFCLCLAALALTSPAPATANDGGAPIVTIVLSPRAEVGGTALTVGDVAEVRADDAQLALAVEAHDLGYAPAPGYSRLLQNHQIGMELQRAFPHVAWVFKGERATRVWPRVEVFSAERIRIAAEDALRVGIGGRDVEYELAEPIADARIPKGETDATISVEPLSSRIRSGRISVPVLLSLGGKPQRRVNTLWDLRVYQTLPVPGRSVVAGEVLSDSLFRTTRVLLDRVNAGAPLPLVSLRGATAARNLTAGQPVTEQDIHRPVVVRSGEGLMVEVRKGAVSARVVGVAVGSGAIGDRIPVRLRDTGREMLARVSSSELAIVELGR